MRFERSAGILLHPTSLPGRFSIGDLGPEAYHFIDFLSSAGQTLWQVLALGPTGYGDSPYQSFSAFAGNHYLISPEKLLEDGLLGPADIEGGPSFDAHRIDYGEAIEQKLGLLKAACDRFEGEKKHPLRKPFVEFCRRNREWLDDFALFMAIKRAHDGAHWNQWEKKIIRRDAATLSSWKRRLASEIGFFKSTQFLFYRQWDLLRRYAHSHGIRVIGDLPIFVSYDSADVWAHRELFTVDAGGKLKTMAGVPPDYFSRTGQLWGNPLYKWNTMAKDDFLWWRRRIGKLLEVVDIIRVDHFRGFEAFWQIPGNAPTAETGKWVKAPGMKFFSTIRKHMGTLPIIAEDLGVITKPVTELREAFEFPGMKILQFAFGTGMERRFLPHNIEPNSVVYTGSHDNDTTRGYFEKARHEPNDMYSSAKRYLACDSDDLTFALIRAAYSSVADIVVIPMQDILNLPTDARMNFPGRAEGNWAWRFTWDQVDPRAAETFRRMAELYERPPVLRPAD